MMAMRPATLLTTVKTVATSFSTQAGKELNRNVFQKLPTKMTLQLHAACMRICI